MANTATTPCPPPPELTAFESRIRTVGETTARLERLADLAVGLLEPRRDHLIAARYDEDAPHVFEMYGDAPFVRARRSLGITRDAAECKVDDPFETRDAQPEEFPVVLWIVDSELSHVGEIRVATRAEIEELYDGGEP